MILQQDVALELVAPPGHVLELALRLRGLERGAAQLVLDHLRAVEPVLDVVALHEDAALRCAASAGFRILVAGAAITS